MSEEPTHEEVSSFIQEIAKNNKFDEFIKVRKRFEPFKMMGIHRKETIHSHILAHFLKRKTENSEHDFFHQFIDPCSSKELLYKNCDFDFRQDKAPKRKVATEYSFDQQKAEDKKSSNFIDILISYDDTVIAIENKLDAREGDKQLERYQKYLNGRPERNKLIIFLTRTGHLPLTHLEEIAENRCNIIVLSWLEVVELFEKVDADPKNEVEQAYLKILIHHFNINFKMKSEIEEECLKLFEEKPEVYEMLVKNYHKTICLHTDKVFRKIQEKLTALKGIVQKNLVFEYKSNLKAKEGRGAFELNVRASTWPQSVFIKIYRINKFGIFPYIDTSHVKELEALKPLPFSFNENIFYYFTIEGFCAKDVQKNDSLRFIDTDEFHLKKGDIDNAIKKFEEYYNGINKTLLEKKIRPSVETDGN